LPAGVVNLLTGSSQELHAHFSTHMDVNAVVTYQNKPDEIKTIQQNASLNVKRVFVHTAVTNPNPYLIFDLQEIKTTWHPIENIGSAKAGY